jgi:N-acetylmuramoyl-L-alanine amidase
MTYTRNLLFVLLCLAWQTVRVSAQNLLQPKNYMTVAARSGDDVPLLLQRYGLSDFPCNITEFFKINRIKEDYRLKSGASYKLPLWVVPYNGKSIRSTLDLTDWQTAKRIEAFNKTAWDNGLRNDNFIESKKLWVPFHEIKCEVTDAPVENAKSGAGKASAAMESADGGEISAKGSRSFPIFGPKNARTPLTGSRMKGKVFYLISGHGGPDSGAQGKRAGNTLCEDEYAYDVTIRLLKLLVSNGATAYMIVRDENDGIRDGNYLVCDKDEVVWGNKRIPLNQKERLQQRTDLINQLTEKHLKAGQRDQTVVEIHVDSRSRDTKTDVFFYYRPESEESKNLAQHIHRTFLEKYLQLRGQRGYMGSVTPRYLFTLQETVCRQAVYIELGNIRNDWDQQRLVIKNNRQAVANWLYQALSTR